MATSATDIAGKNVNRLSTVEVPHLETLEELDTHFEQTYGPDVLKALKDSSVDQADVVRQLHAAGLNGRSEAVERTYRLHQQEFARKESLLGKTWRWTKEAAGTATDVVTAPFRWTWNSFKKRPVLTSAAIAALILAGLYFTPTLAPTVGEYGAGLIEGFKGVLGKVGMATPLTAVDAVAQVPVTGLEGAEAAAEAAAEAFASPGEQLITGQEFAGAADAATGAAEVAPELSEGASQILQSGSNIPGGEALLQPEIVDPLQRAAQGLGPIE
jgi:hypothetical protein